MTIDKNNHIPNIRDLFLYGEAKNFAFDNCLEFIIEKLNEKRKLDYWIFTGITGNGYTPVYNKNDSITACEYCVSGFLAGADYISYVFDTIGYGYTYVTTEQLNANKSMYIQKLAEYIKHGIPVIVIDKSKAPDFFIDALTHYLYVGQEDYEKSFLFSKKADTTLFNKLYALEFISQEWIFVGEKKHDIPLVNIYRNAVKKIPFWLTQTERNGVFFGASAYRAWANDIENGRYDSDIDAWHNYRVYMCNLATIAWANNIDATYTSIVNRFARLVPQYAKMSAQIAEQYHKLGEENISGENGLIGIDYGSGIWKDLEDLGGGFEYYSCDAFRDIENCAKIVGKFREAALRIDRIVQIFLEYDITA